MKWWESMPAWIRWILYVPAVSVSMLAVFFVLGIFLGSVFGTSKPGLLMATFFRYGAGTLLTMYLAQALAPSGKKIALGIWMALAGLIYLAGIAGFILLRAMGQTTSFNQFSEVVGALAGCGVLITIAANRAKFE